MTANKFIQEIVTPLLSLEYWANRVHEEIRDEVFRGIPKKRVECMTGIKPNLK